MKKEGGEAGEKKQNNVKGVEKDNKSKLSFFYIIHVRDVLGLKRLKKQFSGSGLDSTGSGLF